MTILEYCTGKDIEPYCEILVGLAPLPHPILRGNSEGSGWESAEERIHRVEHALDSFGPDSPYPIVAGEMQVRIMCPSATPTHRMLKPMGEDPTYSDRLSELAEEVPPLHSVIAELIQLFRVVLMYHLPPEAKYRFTAVFGNPILTMEDPEQLRGLLERANLSAANLYKLYPKPH